MPSSRALVNPYVSVLNRVAELERAQTMFEHGSDQGKGIQRFLDGRAWELQPGRPRDQKLKILIKRQESRTSYANVVGNDPHTPPGLPAATLHSCPMSIADPLQDWYATYVHYLFELPHVSDAPPPPPLAPPYGGDDVIVVR